METTVSARTLTGISRTKKAKNAEPARAKRAITTAKARPENFEALLFIVSSRYRSVAQMAEFVSFDGLARAALCLPLSGAGHQKTPVTEPSRHCRIVIHHYQNHLDV